VIFLLLIVSIWGGVYSAIFLFFQNYFAVL